jgi:hypothetical protein
MVLCAAAAVTLTAQRIFTTPHPDAELKLLFPAAAAFSPLEGQPLHFKAHAADPRANPRPSRSASRSDDRPGAAGAWLSRADPHPGGHGPTATLTGVIVTYNSERYGYFSGEPPKFAAQFKGKSIRDPFVVRRDVDAVSRASISIGSATRAIRDSSRMMAKQLLPDAVK